VLLHACKCPAGVVVQQLSFSSFFVARRDHSLHGHTGSPILGEKNKSESTLSKNFRRLVKLQFFLLDLPYVVIGLEFVLAHQVINDGLALVRFATHEEIVQTKQERAQKDNAGESYRNCQRGIALKRSKRGI